MKHFIEDVQSLRDNKSTLKTRLEEAFDQGTCDIFVMDYIDFGGLLQDLIDVAHKSDLINTQQFDSIIDNLKANNLIKCEDCCEDNDSFLNYLNDKYCDDTTDELEICSFKDIPDDCVTTSCTLSEDIDLDDSILNNVEIKPLNEVISGLVDNVSEEQLDREIRLFKKIATLLDVQDYSTLFVVVTDDYDPSYFDDGILIALKDGDLKSHTSLNCVSEKLNGLTYIYFRTEEDAKRFISHAYKYLNNFEFDNEGDDMTPYETEEDFSIEDSTIEESLNYLDRKTNNKYNLLNTYVSESYDKDLDEKLRAELIKEDYTIESLLDIMAEEVEVLTEDGPILDDSFGDIHQNDETQVNEDEMFIKSILDCDGVCPINELTVYGDNSLNYFIAECDKRDHIIYEVTNTETFTPDGEPIYTVKLDVKTVEKEEPVFEDDWN